MTSELFLRRVCSCLLALGTAFCLLKLCHVLPLPWPLVLLPFQIVAALVLGSFLFVLGYAFLLGWRSARDEKRHRQQHAYKVSHL